VVFRFPVIRISSPARSADAVQSSSPICRTFSDRKSITPGSKDASNDTLSRVKSLRSTKYWLMSLVLRLRGFRRRRCDAQPLQSIVSMLAKRRIRKFGYEFLIEVLRLVQLLVGFIQRRQLIRHRSLRISARVVELLAHVDRLLRLPVL